MFTAKTIAALLAVALRLGHPNNAYGVCTA